MVRYGVCFRCRREFVAAKRGRIARFCPDCRAKKADSVEQATAAPGEHRDVEIPKP